MFPLDGILDPSWGGFHRQQAGWVPVVGLPVLLPVYMNCDLLWWSEAPGGEVNTTFWPSNVRFWVACCISLMSLWCLSDVGCWNRKDFVISRPSVRGDLGVVGLTPPWLFWQDGLLYSLTKTHCRRPVTCFSFPWSMYSVSVSFNLIFAILFPKCIDSWHRETHIPPLHLGIQSELFLLN